MKRIQLFTLALGLAFILSLNPAKAQTADEILKQYFESTGGLEKWKALRTLTMNVKFNQQGMEFPMTMYRKYPNKEKVVVEFQGKQFIDAFDGEKGWAVNPMATGKAEAYTDEQNKEKKEEMFEDELIDYAAKGHKVVLEGKETIEGTECFKIKLTKKNGEEEWSFFDQDYVLIMQRTTIKTGAAKGQVVETFLSDYKEANGLYFPHSITTKVGGQVAAALVIEKISTTDAIDDKIFVMPSN
ncbi:MAG: hypothetical protein EAZ55_04530 [Cytophagales bacterium]|nr:MAG: hypothetical protein EAZ55_04530 [Cytophagales bacterium]